MYVCMYLTKILKKKPKARPISTFKVDECFEHDKSNEAVAQHGSDVENAVPRVQILCDSVTEVKGYQLSTLGPKFYIGSFSFRRKKQKRSIRHGQ